MNPLFNEKVRSRFQTRYGETTEFNMYKDYCGFGSKYDKEFAVSIDQKTYEEITAPPLGYLHKQMWREQE